MCITLHVPKVLWTFGDLPMDRAEGEHTTSELKQSLIAVRKPWRFGARSGDCLSYEAGSAHA